MLLAKQLKFDNQIREFQQQLGLKQENLAN
jgi:hypothetical protein